MIAPWIFDDVKKELNDVSFVTITTDTSNHTNIKMFPIVARYFTIENGVSNKVIETVDLRDEKALTMESQIEQACEQFNISDKVTGFGGDNAPVNFGGITRGGDNNVFALMREKFKNCSYGFGCNAHISHNTVDHAVSQIELFDVESIVVKAYKHFAQHTVRLTRLKDICDDAGIEYEKLLGYGATRFLAFKGCIDRIISQFESLKIYFTDPNEKSSPPKLQQFFKCPIAKLLLIFIRDQCQIFEDSIKRIEGDVVTAFDALEIMTQVKLVVECRLKDEFRSSAFRVELQNVTKLLPYEFTIVKTSTKKKQRKDIVVNIDEDYLNDIFQDFYSNCIEYLTKWIEPLLPVKIWSWASLRKVPEWKDIEPCVDELTKKKFLGESDDVKVHAEFCNVKLIISQLLPNWEKEETTTENRWIEAMKLLRSKNVSFNHFFKIVEYAMVMPGNLKLLFVKMPVELIIREFVYFLQERVQSVSDCFH